MGFQVNTEESITKDEVIDEIYRFLNGTIEKYVNRAKENDSCRVYIKDMYYVPSSCACCPFIQNGNVNGFYRCKLGGQFPYGFDYKHKRSEDCRLVQKGD